MEIKRLRKTKTVRTEDILVLTEKAKKKTADAFRRQQIEIMKIPEAYGEECLALKSCGYEIMRASRNLSVYFEALSGTMETDSEKIDLCEFMDFLCEKARPYLEKAEIRLLCKTPKEKVIANIDKEGLSYSVFDIIRNAAEYSPAKSRIKLTLQKLQKFAKITIEDKGEGMDEETICHCAEPLFCKTNPKGEKGMGLGLSLAEYFIHACGGRVKIASEKGRGTSVSVFIPFLENEEGSLTAEDYKTMQKDGKYIPAAVVFSGIGKNAE